MATPSATAVTDQKGDVFNSPLINNGFVRPGVGGVAAGNNTIVYAVAGVIGLLLILKLVK